MEELLVKHFKDLLMETPKNRTGATQRTTQHIPQLITQDQNMALMHTATLEEVEEIVKGMQKNKAARPDGFTAKFYQATWHFVGQDILEVVEESRCIQKVCPSLNSTFITLIPKTASLMILKDFGPLLYVTSFIRLLLLS